MSSIQPHHRMSEGGGLSSAEVPIAISPEDENDEIPLADINSPPEQPNLGTTAPPEIGATPSLTQPLSLVKTVAVNSGICMCTHAIWGFFPVLLRHLQTVEKISTLPLLALCSSILLLCCGPVALRKEAGFAPFKNRKLWMFSVVVTARSITNLYATRLTHATLVMLTQLSTPYFVSLFTRIFSHEQLPRAFFSTLLFSVVGGTMVLSSDIARLDFASLQTTDAWGMLMSFASAMFLAGYMVCVRICKKDKIGNLTVFCAQMAACILFATCGSLTSPKSWNSFGALGFGGWCWFGLYVIVMFVGNHSQIWAIGRVGAPFNSMFIGWRLCVTVACGWTILGERLRSPFQAVGVVIVIASTSTFVYLQTKKKPEPAAAATTVTTTASPPEPPSGKALK